ncbi:MAG: hypothetical protein KFF73_03040 [Cyclobacteriaceae bacterium]|nr:hypothetical protein [Cyclobacteriaceae bacterium]
MKFRKKLLFLLWLILFLNACHQGEDSHPESVFDLEGFINSQVVSLSMSEHQLKKRTGIGSNAEILMLVPDSTGWQKELSIFKTAAIHKPGLRDFYSKNVIDSGENEIEEYFLKDTSQSETIFLRVVKEKKSSLVRLIEAGQHTDNPIYNSGRDLFLKFLPVDKDNVLLDSFAVSGYQKMVLQDSVIYFTGGKIIMP